jgi:hypothetical protein
MGFTSGSGLTNVSKEKLEKFLDGKDKKRINRSNCVVHKEDKNIVIRLFGNPIMKVMPNGLMELSLCGWDTVTTRKYLSDLTPSGIGIFNYKNKSWISRNFLFRSESYPFVSGIIVNSNCDIKYPKGMISLEDSKLAWIIDKESGEVMRKVGHYDIENNKCPPIGKSFGRVYLGFGKWSDYKYKVVHGYSLITKKKLMSSQLRREWQKWWKEEMEVKP